MIAEALAALRLVLDETPEPPAADTDPYDVIGAVGRMATRRELPIASLQRLLGHHPTADGEGIALLATIQERNTRWQAALARARHALAERRSALDRLRRVNRGWMR